MPLRQDRTLLLSRTIRWEFGGSREVRGRRRPTSRRPFARNREKETEADKGENGSYALLSEHIPQSAQTRATTPRARRSVLSRVQHTYLYPPAEAAVKPFYLHRSKYQIQFSSMLQSSLNLPIYLSMTFILTHDSF